MILKKHTFVCAAALLFLTSCTHYFYPALMNNDVAYQPKPLSTDSSKTANYISGGLVSGFTTLADSYSYGVFDIGRAHTLKGVNIYYGAFGTAGTYSSSESSDSDPTYFRNKNFSTLGGRFSINAYTHVGRADVRFIGAEVAYSHEYGDYAAFRKSTLTTSDTYVDSKTDLTTVALTSEVAWRGLHNSQIQYAVRAYVSATPGHHVVDYFYGASTYENTNQRNFSMGGSFFVQVHRFFGIIENGDMFHTSLRVGYRF